MKKLKDPIIAENCDHNVHDTVYAGNYQPINLKYSRYIPRLYFTPLKHF